MGLVAVIPPAVESPVTLGEVQAYLRVTSDGLNEVIQSHINAALGQLDGRDGWLNRALCTQTWDQTLDNSFCGGPIALELNPVQSITSVKYLDGAGVEQTLAGSAYQLQHDASGLAASVAPAYGLSWPSTRAQPGAVTVRFVAGYGNAGQVPEAIKTYLKALVALLFNGTPIPDAIERQMANYRVFPVLAS